MTRTTGVFVLVIGLALAGAICVWAQSDATLTILIASPAEGATFYAVPGRFRLAMPISGQVVSYTGHLDPATVEVHLALFSQDGSQLDLDVPVDDEGRFQVWASLLSPDLPWPSDDFHVREMCGTCHRKVVDLSLPETVSHLVVTARAADGRTSQVTRNIHFDLSHLLPLQVTVDGLPEDAEGVQVSATTLIYAWRRRTFIAEAQAGQATLMVEGLRYADVTYTVSMPPVVIDGTRYQAEAQMITVPAAAEEPLIVTLTAVPSRGAITGRVLESGTGAGLAAALLLVEPATGASHVTTADAGGAFAFEDLPIVEYALLAQTPGYIQIASRLDLAEEPTAAIETFLIPAGPATLRGMAVDRDTPLPFVEATITGLPTAYGDPLTGMFSFPALPIIDNNAPVTVEISAAGYYSARIVTTDGDLGTIELTLREDTRVVERNGVRLYIPATSIVREEADAITLERGVLWVSGGAASDPTPFRIRVGRYELAGNGATFAIERLVGAAARLYVGSGEVLATQEGREAPLAISLGQTMTLDSDTASPVALDAGTGSLLRALAGAVTTFELPPSPEELRDAAVKQGVVTIARGFLIGAYAIAYVLMPAAIVIGAALLIARYVRARRGDPNAGR